MARTIQSWATRTLSTRFGLLGALCLALTAVFVMPSLPVSANPEPAEAISADEFAARHGLSVTDAGTYVTLKGPLVTMRLYPGTSDVTVQGARHKLKVPIRRDAGTVMIPDRPVRFLSRELSSTRTRILDSRKSLDLPEIKPIAPAPKLPTRVEPTEPADPKTVPTPTVLDRSPDPRWEPKSAARAWRWIVIHHSDDQSGNAAKYDRVHREVNGWDSLGYHFVIGNGTLSGDGEVEVGPRWPKQKHGAHARDHSLGDNRYNERGIGICLVGDFDEGDRQPTQRQMEALGRLTRWLMAQYDVPASMVIRHCEVCKTRCPGRHFPWIRFQQQLGTNAAEPAEPVPGR